MRFKKFLNGKTILREYVGGFSECDEDKRNIIKIRKKYMQINNNDNFTMNYRIFIVQRLHKLFINQHIFHLQGHFYKKDLLFC